jgi:hypothetical protein
MRETFVLEPLVERRLPRGSIFGESFPDGGWVGAYRITGRR